MATWSAGTAPGQPQELLVRDETRITLLAKPSRMTLGQLCVAPQTSRTLPAATEPGLDPGCLVAQLALRCSALNHCATQEAPGFVNLICYTGSLVILV